MQEGTAEHSTTTMDGATVSRSLQVATLYGPRCGPRGRRRADGGAGVDHDPVGLARRGPSAGRLGHVDRHRPGQGSRGVRPAGALDGHLPTGLALVVKQSGNRWSSRPSRPEKVGGQARKAAASVRDTATDAVQTTAGSTHSLMTIGLRMFSAVPRAIGGAHDRRIQGVLVLRDPLLRGSSSDVDLRCGFFDPATQPPSSPKVEPVTHRVTPPALCGPQYGLAG
jgi:hypothetical protein